MILRVCVCVCWKNLPFGLRGSRSFCFIPQRRLSPGGGRGWFLLSCLSHIFLPKKACGRSVTGWKGHFYCTQQRLIPDWRIAGVKSHEQVRACTERIKKHGTGTSFIVRKPSAHEALVTPQTGSGEKHTHVLPETAGEPPPDLYQDPNGSKKQATGEITRATTSEAAFVALWQQKKEKSEQKIHSQAFSVRILIIKTPKMTLVHTSSTSFVIISNFDSLETTNNYRKISKLFQSVRVTADHLRKFGF